METEGEKWMVTVKLETEEAANLEVKLVSVI